MSKEAWFVVSLQRAQGTLQDVVGGVSALPRGVFNKFFDADGHDMSRSGISLKLHGGALVRFFGTRANACR